MIAACQRDKIAAAIKIAKAIVLQARSKSRRCVGVRRLRFGAGVIPATLAAARFVRRARGWSRRKTGSNRRE